MCSCCIGLSCSAQDPPDEVIPKLIFTRNPTISPELPVRSESILSSVVSSFSTNLVWKVRTVLAILCAVSVVLMEDYFGLTYSSVVLMSLLDSTLLLYIMLSHQPSKSDTVVNPLGKISLLKVPLMLLVHSSYAKWFDSVCLSVLLIGLLLRDIFIMISVTILLRCTTFMLAQYILV